MDELFLQLPQGDGPRRFRDGGGAETAGRDEATVRRKLIETGAVDIMVAVRSNFFYTRTVPCMLWFLDRDKKTAAHKNQVLMIDARNIYRKVTRKIYDFSPEQEQNLLAIVWLYRGETERFTALVKRYKEQSAAVDLSPVAEFGPLIGESRRMSTVGEIEAAAKAALAACDTPKARKPIEEAASATVEALKLKAYYLAQADWLETCFPDAKFRDVEGLVKAVTREEIAANDWSLTPGRYVGVAEDAGDDEDFAETMSALHAELRELNAKAADLAATIDANWKELVK